MNEIDYLTTDEMIVELQKRHDALIIVGLQHLDADRVAYSHRDSGGDVTCLGLAEYASTKIRANILARSQERQEEAEDIE